MAGSAVFETTAFMAGVRAVMPVVELLALADVRDSAERIAARAKELAPVGTPEEGDPHPGAMRDDISMRGEGIDAKGPYVDVGTVEPYGLFQEFGTEHNEPHPFMRPAIAEEMGGSATGRVNIAPRARKR